MTIDLVRMSLTPSGQAGAEQVGTLAVQVGISSAAFGDVQRSTELPAFDFQIHPLREVAFRYGSDHAGYVRDRLYQIADEVIH